MLPTIRFPWTARRTSATPKRSRRVVPSAEGLEGRELLSTFSVTNTNMSLGSLRPDTPSIPIPPPSLR
jgi:hypothetical protein